MAQGPPRKPKPFIYLNSDGSIYEPTLGDGEADAARGDATVDVVSNYSWTVSNSVLARAEVPIIEITEYQQTVSSMRQAAKFFAGQFEGLIKGRIKDPYSNLYAIGEKGNTYILPYYAPYHHAIQNNWGENKGTVGETVSKISNFVGEWARAIYPSAGIEGQKTFEGSTAASYQFTFHLLNTVGNTEENINKNKQFIRAIINNNLLDKIDVVAVRPPAICSIRIPGVRGRTIGVLQTINVESIGQINRIGGENVPDAFQITITVQELLTESRQIFADELKDEVVFARIEATQFEEGAQGTIDASKSGAKKVGEAVGEGAANVLGV